MSKVLLKIAVAVWWVLAGAANSAEPSVAANAADSNTSTQLAERDRLIKTFKSKGYKERFRKGEVVYCRKEAPLGSRFEQLVCLSESRLKQKLNDEAAAQLEHTRSGVCIGEKCAGN